MNEILLRVAGTVASAIVMSLMALLSPTIRRALFYQREEHFVFEHQRGAGSCDWDIQWPNHLRLTMKVGDVSNDRIDNVEFIINATKGGPAAAPLQAKDTFQKLDGGEILVRLASITRISGLVDAQYRVRLVFRRRRHLAGSR